LQCKLQHDVAKKVELNLESSVLTNFLSGVLNAANLQTEKLPGDLQNASTLFVAGFQFLLLQLNCDLVVGAQDRTYSFRNARNREDAAQRLQRFVHWEVSFEGTLHCRFTSSEYPRASPEIKTISVNFE
jgi:hypothetical protein